MPVYGVRGGVAVELIADVDEVLDGRNVDIVDRRKVEDDGFESRSVRFNGDGFAAARARIVPRAVLKHLSVEMTGNAERGWGEGEGAYAEFGVEGRVGAAGFFKDGGNHVVEVVVGVRVVEAFREAVDEYTWIW